MNVVFIKKSEQKSRRSREKKKLLEKSYQFSKNRTNAAAENSSKPFKFRNRFALLAKDEQMRRDFR